MTVPPFTASVTTGAEHVMAWVSVSGELDCDTVPRLERTLRSALSEARIVLLDLRELELMDGSGTVAIDTAVAMAEQSGRQLMVLRATA